MNKYRIVSDGKDFYWVQVAYGMNEFERWENNAHNSLYGKSIDECENKLKEYIKETKDSGKIVVEKELYF
jgi:hypothetical protein